MSTKRIGNIGEAKVLSKFVELGFPVYIPFGDNERADLVVEFGGKLNKIQVKTTESDGDGQVTFYISSSSFHRVNGKRHKYSTNEIDYFALYSVVRDKIYLMRVPEQPKTTISIRYEGSRNGQLSGLNFENDFLIDKVLAQYV